eukprot:Sspe_Gene.36333::Locus_17567_Transcript_1_1_Confidence_1.000_Length_3414::g.36333::m.36333/K06225/PTCH1; patched 1
MAEEGNEGFLEKYHHMRNQWAQMQTRTFVRLGRMLSDNPLPFVFIPLIIMIGLGIGVLRMEVDSDPVKLWVQKGSRVEDDKEHYDDFYGALPRPVNVHMVDRKGGSVLSKEHLKQLYDVDASILDQSPRPDPKCSNITVPETCKNEAHCTWWNGQCMFADQAHVFPSFMQRQAVTYKYKGVKWGMRELCMESFAPTLPGIPAFRLPCSRQNTPMDCFTEPPATLLWSADDQFIKWGATHNTSFQQPLNDLQFALAGMCAMWNRAPNAKSMTMGGVTMGIENGMPKVEDVQAWKLVYPLLSARSLLRKYEYMYNHAGTGMLLKMAGYPHPANMTEDDMENILEGYEQEVEAHLDQLNKKYAEDGASGDLAWLTIWKVEDIVEDTSTKNGHYVAIAVALLLVVVWASLFRLDLVASRFLLGLGAVIVVLIAVFAMMGFTALVGISFNGLSLRVLPYVALGLGIDDVFVVLTYFDEDVSTTVEERMKRAYGHAGPSITTTSSVNLLAFLMGLVIPLKAINDFALSAAFGVIFNYFAVLLSFGGLLSLDAHRIYDRRYDMAVCMKREHHASGPSDRAGKMVVKYLIKPAITTVAGQVVLMVLSCALLGVSIWGCTEVEMGLGLYEVLDDDTIPHKYLVQRKDYFHSSSNFLMGKEADWTSIPTQAKLNKMVSFDLMNPKNDYKLPIGKMPHADKNFLYNAVAWSTNFRWFALQFAIGHSPTNNPCDCEAYIDRGEIPDRILLSPMCTVNPKYYMDLLGLWLGYTRAAVPTNRSEAAPTMEGMCNKTQAEMAARMKEAEEYGLPKVSDIMRVYGFGVNLPNPAAFGSQYIPELFLDMEWREASQDHKVTGIKAWRIGLLNAPVEQTDIENSIDLVEEYRDYLDSTEIPVYAYGPTFLYVEQYLHLRKNLTKMLGIALGVTLVLLSILMASFGLGVIQTAVITMSMVTIIASVPALGLKLNSMSVLSIVFGVGVNVEMVVHISRAFLNEQGTRRERTVRALEQMLGPVFAGAVTTVFGVIVLAWSGTDFLRDYFFAFYSLMVASGMWYSCATLPVLLCWFGSRSFPANIFDDASKSQAEPINIELEAGKLAKTEPIDEPPADTDK